MRINRLGQLLAQKYKVAVDFSKDEALLRNKIDNLYDAVYRKGLKKDMQSVLLWCANAPITNKTNVQGKSDALVKKGQEVANKIVSIIDYLKANKTEVNLEDMENSLLELVSIIEENKDGSGASQFPALYELIFMHGRRGTKYDRKLNDDQVLEMRTTLKLIYGIALGMIKDIKELQDENIEVPERFKNQRGNLSVYDIVDFLRQHGSKYELEDRDDWRYVVEHNEPLKQKLTTVINALNRGHSPRDAFEVGKEIKELLNRRDEINAPTNESFFGAPEEEAQRQMTELRDPSDKAMKELRDEKELKKLELEDEANEEEQAQLKKLIEKRDQEHQMKQIEKDQDRHIRSEGMYRLDGILERYL